MKRFKILLIVLVASLGTIMIIRAGIMGEFSVLPTENVIGDKIDSLNGVYVYYNGSVSHVDGRNLTPDGYNLGLKYQCVEFVKRYYYEHYDHKMPDSYGHAKSFFKAGLEEGAVNKDRNLFQYPNGGKTSPKVGDLLVFDGNVWNEYGHVAIVSEVGKEDIEIVQQNPGPGAASRIRIGLKQEEGRFTLAREDALGWLRK